MSKHKFFLYLVTFLVLVGCSSQVQTVPKLVKGKSIAYHVNKIGGPFDNNILNKTLVYEYHNDGSYQAFFLETKELFESGNYSYVRKSTNKASIALTYSTQNGLYTYIFEMHFDSVSSGSWHAVFSNNPGDTQDEGGVFHFLPKGAF
ncbi:MAG: hypothetical protein S4CHLAM7_00700 [Chlamydiae bacterium]|nr:hypothetical protein [Chlamydiota bacterium]